MKDEVHDVVVIGGGAAGLMAALFAARAGARTVCVEGSKQCGIKILVSGGGRCNVLPSVVDDSDYFTSGSRNVMKRIFRTWTRDAQHRFFEEELGVELVVEPDTGKLFPKSQDAKEVRDALVRAATDAGVTIRTRSRVRSVVTGRGGEFDIEVEDGRDLRARRLILATGGQSMPRTGSDGAGYRLAKAFGHSILDPYPALVPLTTSDERYRELSGISLPVRWSARAGDRKPVEERTRDLLFTHKGFSGPAILDASHWAVRDGLEVRVAWNAVGEEEWRKRLEPSKDAIGALVTRELPRRLADVVLERAGVDRETQTSQLSKKARNALVRELTNASLDVTGSTGFGVAEVTGGGVPLEEVDPKTLESRKQPGLYLCGEILDVIGRIGGFNFMWAWATGRMAGEKAGANGERQETRE